MDKEWIGIYFGTPTIIILLIILMMFGAYQIDKTECRAKANAIGFKCEYGIWQGCVLEKPDGKKILLEQLREVGE